MNNKNIWKKLFLKETIKLSKKSLKNNEVPVGAIIVDEKNNIVSRGFNKKEANNNVLDHAEIIAIKKLAKKKQTWKLNNFILYSTLEPCDLCKEVIKVSRIEKVVYFTKQMKKINYKTKWEYEKHNEASEIIKKFFKKKK